MTHHVYRFAAIVAAVAAPFAAHATLPVPVPEPGTLSLLALGVAAAAIVHLRNRRK